PFNSGDRVLAFVNGMGGTPLIELYLLYNEVAKLAQQQGLTIERNLIGNYITSLEMQGCSITLLRLDDEMIRYWDAPVDTPALRWGVRSPRRDDHTLFARGGDPFRHTYDRRMLDGRTLPPSRLGNHAAASTAT